MPKPLTIHYQETAFTLQWDANRQVVHDRVYDTLLEGEHIPNEQRTRTFLYDLTLLDEDTGLGMVTARATEFRPGIESQAQKLVVSDNDELVIRARLSAMKRSRDKNGTKSGVRHTLISPSSMTDWAATFLERHAMKADSIEVLGIEQHKVRKTSLVFGIQEAFLEARVTVTSAVPFAKAFMSGMGTHKGYGLGMMEILR